MSWGKIDDRLPEHPKWMELERKVSPRMWADALATWVVVLCYANRNETDGVIEATLLARLSPIGRDAIKAAEALVDVRLMEKTEHGYRLHDFTDYNPSKAKKIAERKADAERKQAPKAIKPPTGIRPESDRSALGVQSDAKRIPDVPARPGPTPPLEDLRKGDLDQVGSAPTPSRSIAADSIRKGFARAYVEANETPPPATKDVDGAPWHALVDFGRVESERHAITVEDVGYRLGQGARQRKRFAIKWLVENPREFFIAAPTNTLGGGESEADLVRDLQATGSTR